MIDKGVEGMRGMSFRVLGLLIALTSCAVAQEEVRDFVLDGQGPNFLNNFSGNFLGGGARAEGMGKAFLGVSDDISALSWNPAGLISFEKSVIGLSLNSFRPRGTFNDGGLVHAPRGDYLESKQNASLSNLDMLSILSPIRVRGHQFVVSASYTRLVEDYSTVFAQYSDFQPHNGFERLFAYPYTVDARIERKATPYAVSVGFGTRMRGNLSIGLAINVFSGKQRNRTEYFFLAPSYLAPDLVGPQFVEMSERLTLLDTFSFAGTNFTLGAKGSSGQFSYGAVIKSGFDLKLKGGSTIGDTILYGGYAQPGQSTTFYVDEQLMTFSIPWIIAGGVAFRPTDKLLLAADVEYRPFEGKAFERRDSVQIRSGQDNLEFFTPVDPGWFNCIGLRTGMEYLWSTGSTFAPTVPLRCGFGYTQVPSPSYDLESRYRMVADSILIQLIDFPTSSTAQFNIAAGAGIYWAQIHLDVAYSYTTLNRKEPTLVYGRDFDWRVTYGELKTRNHNLSMTFTGYF